MSARTGPSSRDRHDSATHATGRRVAGFSLIELLIVMAVIGIMATIAVPQLLQAYDRSRQRKTMADMRSIAGANGTYRVDNGGYASAFADLAPDYLSSVPGTDAWGNGFAYSGSRANYTLTSFGLDGAAGPAAPSPWYDEPFEVDLVVTNGTFTQAPESQ